MNGPFGKEGKGVSMEVAHELTLDELRELASAHGVTRVEEPVSYAFPSVEEVDFTRFGADGALVKNIYECLYDWLRLPYVYDRFADDHAARRGWRKALPVALRVLVEDNRFRSNVTGAALSMACMLDDHVASEIHDQIDRILNQDEPHATQCLEALKYVKTVPERRALIDQIEAKIVQIMRLLAGKE